MNSTAIILAAGNGRRFGSEIPKQFIEIHGYPLLWYSLNSFKKFDSSIRIILVLNESYLETWQQICKNKNIDLPHEVVTGGKSRSESVKNALSGVPNEGIVFIHDAARPCLSADLLGRIKKGVLENRNAIPVIPESNSLRIKHEKAFSYLDREKVLLVQTPQCFLNIDIKRAYKGYFNSKSKDDAGIAEDAGIKIYHVKGDHENIKVTYPFDLEIAGVILGKRNK